MRSARVERVASPRREHPWERERRLSFARWEAEMRRTAYGRSVSDVVGFADAVEPPLHWSDWAGDRRLFAFSALPTGPSPTYLAIVPSGRRRPAPGSLVRLSRPIKRAMPGPDASYGELVLEAREGAIPAKWEDLLAGASAHAAAGVVRSLAELWQLPVSVTEALLLPLVGSLPWHGRPAGLDLYLEVEGWSLERHRALLSNVVTLAPDWVSTLRRTRTGDSGEVELASGARVRRASPSVARPFSIQLRPVSAPPAGRAPADAPPRSVLTYGKMISSEFEAALSAGHTTLLIGAEDARRVPHKAVEVPESLRTTVWALHWWIPEPPDAPDWHRWLRNEDSRLRSALERAPHASSKEGLRGREAWIEGREFRDRLAQAAFSRARLRGAVEVEESDLTRTVDLMVQTIERSASWATVGRGPWTRALDRTEGGRTYRLRRALESLFEERSEGLTAVETIAAMQTRGPAASAWDVENQLERLRIRGLLFQDRSGRYRIA